MILDVNNSDVIKHVNRLERVRSKSMPYAIRNTLNDIAFDTRKRQIRNTKKRFVNRQQNFFSSRINVKKAQGLSVKTMESESGVFARNTSKKEQPVFNLKQQDQGGSLFVGAVPTKNARGGNESKKIQSNSQLRRAKVRESSKKATAMKSYIARHAIAAKTGKMIKGKSAIYRVTGIYRASKDKIAFNKELLYVRHYGVKNYRKKPFVHPSEQWLRQRMNNRFTDNIKKQLEFVK